jgi:hypothetical protein
MPVSGAGACDLYFHSLPALFPPLDCFIERIRLSCSVPLLFPQVKIKDLPQLLFTYMQRIGHLRIWILRIDERGLTFALQIIPPRIGVFA